MLLLESWIKHKLVPLHRKLSKPLTEHDWQRKSIFYRIHESSPLTRSLLYILCAGFLSTLHTGCQSSRVLGRSVEWNLPPWCHTWWPIDPCFCEWRNLIGFTDLLLVQEWFAQTCMWKSAPLIFLILSWERVHGFFFMREEKSAKCLCSSVWSRGSWGRL